MYAKGKGIHVKLKNVKNAKGTKKVIFEYRHDLKDELDCDKGYVDDVKCNDCEDNKNPCNNDDTSYKDVDSCKDDDTSYKDVGSCKKGSTLCRNDIMKSRMWPKQKEGKIDDSDGNKKLTDDKSYNHDGSCRDDSTSCRNNIMKSRMWPK